MKRKKKQAGRTANARLIIKWWQDDEDFAAIPNKCDQKTGKLERSTDRRIRRDETLRNLF